MSTQQSKGHHFGRCYPGSALLTIFRQALGALFKVLAVFLFVTTSLNSAPCTIQIPISSDKVPSDSVSWSGCLSSGIGVQSALDWIALSGGSLVFSGNGSLLVQTTLQVGDNTQINGEYVEGDNQPFQIYGDHTPGSTFRSVHDSLFEIRDSNNVTFWNIRFIGNSTTHPSYGPSMFFIRSTGIAVKAVKIDNLKFGLAALESEDIVIQYVSLFQSVGTAEKDSPASGFWITDCSNVLIDQNNLYAYDYYLSGPPIGDSRSDADSEAPVDSVSIHGGNNIRVQGNRIIFGNTAAIYLACLTGVATPDCTEQDTPQSVILWNNTIQYFRQHGIDVGQAAQPQILTNRVSEVDLALLNIADVYGARIQYNVLEEGGIGNNRVERIFGAVDFSWGAHDNLFSVNTVDISSGGYPSTVLLRDSEGEYGPTENNEIHSNRLWKGEITWIDDVSGLNNIGQNRLY